eukprot:Lankesteria_metandrocarpae@DN5253_c0_g1_i2.p2
MVFFGQLVVGPPGSGKSTYCNGMQQMCRAICRNVVIINLDPANDRLPYDVDIDVCHLISVDTVMDAHNLGPNGSLVYCIDYLLANFDWLETELKKHKDSYIIFDLPGQVELFTHHPSLRLVIERLLKVLDCRLTAVHLVDSTFCTDPAKYISALMVCLGTQAQLELPHVNVLSKLDILKTYRDQLDFRIEFYAQAEGLSHLLRLITSKHEHPLDMKFARFEEALCELIEDHNLVSFHLLDIQKKESVFNLLKVVDTANGFCIGGLPEMSSLFELALQPTEPIGVYENVFGTVQENYIDVDSPSEIPQSASLE